MEPTDQEWLTQFVTDRDEKAFASLVQRYEGLVRSVCGRVLRDQHLAEDAFQASFLILAGQAPALARRSGPLAGWLQTVATNAARQLRRSRIRTQKREATATLQPREAPLTELVGILDEELQQLDLPSREAIVMCHLCGRTQDEAAAELGVSKSTLRRRIERGLGLLRSRFSKRGLFLPVFAVLWNAIHSESAQASSPNMTSQLADTAVQLARGRTVRPTTLLLSHTAWNLSQGILTMKRWHRIRRWSLAALFVGSLGAWEIWSQGSEAADPIANPSGRVTQAIEQVRGTQPHSTKDLQQKPIEPQAPKPLVAQGTEAVRKVEVPKVASKPDPKDDLLNKLKAVKDKAQDKKAVGKLAAPPFNLQPFPGQAKSSFSGVMNINGQEFRTTDPAEFERMMQKNGGMFPKPNPGAGAKSFQGVINKNGVEQKFNDPDEFIEAAIEADFELPILPGVELP